METSKTKTSFYRRLYVAWLIDSGAATSVPAIMEATGMPRRTAQDTLLALGELDIDLRYDYGRVAEVAGNLDLAAAQADTILQQAPNHLLGLVLTMRVADRRGDTARRNQFAQRLLAAESSERAKDLEEYRLHQGDLEAALAAARSYRP